MRASSFHSSNLFSLAAGQRVSPADAAASFTKDLLVDVNYEYRKAFTNHPTTFLLISPNNDTRTYTPNPELWD